MARQIQIRRGTATEHNSFIGAIGEVTMDTTNNTLRVHDGETAGGTALACADFSNIGETGQSFIQNKCLSSYSDASKINLSTTAGVWIAIPETGLLYITALTSNEVSWLVTYIGTESDNVKMISQINTAERGFNQAFMVKKGQSFKLDPRNTTVQNCCLIPL